MERNNATTPDQNEADEPGETISHGDGALELEPPEEGSTLESAPDGGLRAWLIVLACAGINLLLSILLLLIRTSLLDDNMSSDTGIKSDTLEEMADQYVELSNVFAPLGAFVMIFLGYKATVCIGAGVVMTTLIFLSYLGDDDTEKFIKFLLYGPTAIGVSFIQLGALIPVLEYFTTKRMKAIFLSRLGTYLGQLFLLIIFLSIRFSSSLKVKWREFLRGCSGLCIGIGILGLTLKELKLKMKDGEQATFVQRTLGLAKKDILKNVLFWLTCVVYFFYQWGIETPQTAIVGTADRLNLGGSLAKTLFFGLSPTLGLILGMFLAWMFKKIAFDESSRLHVGTFRGYDRFSVIFGILIVAAATMGIACFIAPHAVKFGYFFLFSLLFSASFAFCEGLRDDAVPDEFGRENVRIVEALIVMSAGLGGVITNEIGGEIDDGDDDDWKTLFRYGGGMLMVSSIVTAIVLFLYKSKRLDEIHAKIHGNAVVPLRANDSQQNGKTSNKKHPKEINNGVNNHNTVRARNVTDESTLRQKHDVNHDIGFQP